MSCLDATFTLTPRSPWYYAAPYQWSEFLCFGADFLLNSPEDYSSLYSTDRFLFKAYTAPDPNIDYTQWVNRMRVPHLEFGANLTGYGTAKQLALIFGFDVATQGRVLVYNDASLVIDQTLAPNDNQFLLEIESLDSPFDLYFIHAGGD